MGLVFVLNSSVSRLQRSVADFNVKWAMAKNVAKATQPTHKGMDRWESEPRWKDKVKRNARKASILGEHQKDGLNR